MLGGVRRLPRRIARIQRRVWLTQMLLWPASIGAATAVIAGMVFAVRRRSPDGRHVMPEMPGVHETGTVRVAPDGQLSEL